jgi:hypothetical protein
LLPFRLASWTASIRPTAIRTKVRVLSTKIVLQQTVGYLGRKRSFDGAFRKRLRIETIDELAFIFALYKSEPKADQVPVEHVGDKKDQANNIE